MILMSELVTLVIVGLDREVFPRFEMIWYLVV